MKVLVTGCAGFIGWKTAELLLSQGHTVAGIDNLDPAYDLTIKKWRLSKLSEHLRFHFCEEDITDRVAVGQFFSRYCENPNLDAVIHLAAKTGVRESVRNPWAYVETNLLGTLNLLENCREFLVKKFVLASTSSIYGTEARPFREESANGGPLSPYGASKRGAEVLAQTYHKLHGLDVSALRYFTVYGPAGRPDMSIFRFIKSISEAEPIRIYGDGTQERDFTYVDDIARGTILALKPVGFEIVNLGSGNPVSVLEVVKRIEQLLGQSARIRFEAAHPADAPATWAETSKAQRLLGWRPQISLDEGLKEAAGWYNSQRQWASKIS